MNEKETDDEWTYSIDEVGPGGEVESEPDPVEAGSPKAEHVLFFALGVVAVLGAFVAVVL